MYQYIYNVTQTPKQVNVIIRRWYYINNYIMGYSRLITIRRLYPGDDIALIII